LSTNRREQIFATALQLFARYGYKKTTVEDIAGALGLTKGALYLYVKNKQDLYEKTAAWALLEWQQKVRDTVMDIADPVERFRVMAICGIEYLLGNEELLALISAETDFYADLVEKEPFASIHRDSAMMMENVLNEGIESGVFRQVDAAATAGTLFPMYMAFIAQAKSKAQREDMMPRYRNMLDIMCAGLMAK
jgi:AcrR family transcriptional regulator